jgi:hypothetical protein
MWPFRKRDCLFAAIRGRVPGFPYKIIYFDLPDQILIVAIANDSRRPGYWHPRLRE